MRNITIYGHSDDLVYVEGGDGEHGEPDEISAPYEAPVFLHILNDKNPFDGFMIRLDYCWEGCWFIGIGPLFEGKPLPNFGATPEWDLHWHYNEDEFNAYATVLTVTMPDTVKIKDVTERDE